MRSTTSLIQIIWRATRNPDSEVILYSDKFTEAIIKSPWETYRRRGIQEKFNTEHWIKPLKATSNTKDLESVKTDENLIQDFSSIMKNKNKRLKRMTKKEKALILTNLKSQLDDYIKTWEFEKAAIVRDQIKEIEGDNIEI